MLYDMKHISPELDNSLLDSGSINTLTVLGDALQITAVTPLANNEFYIGGLDEDRGFIAALDRKGRTIWARHLEFTSPQVHHYVRQITIGPDGIIWVAAGSHLFRLAQDGELISFTWMVYGGFVRVFPSDDGGAVVTGFMSSCSENACNLSYFVAALDPDYLTANSGEQWTTQKTIWARKTRTLQNDVIRTRDGGFLGTGISLFGRGMTWRSDSEGQNEWNTEFFSRYDFGNPIFDRCFLELEENHYLVGGSSLGPVLVDCHVDETLNVMTGSAFRLQPQDCPIASLSGRPSVSQLPDGHIVLAYLWAESPSHYMAVSVLSSSLEHRETRLYQVSSVNLEEGPAGPVCEVNGAGEVVIAFANLVLILNLASNKRPVVARGGLRTHPPLMKPPFEVWGNWLALLEKRISAPSEPESNQRQMSLYEYTLDDKEAMQEDAEDISFNMATKWTLNLGTSVPNASASVHSVVCRAATRMGTGYEGWLWIDEYTSKRTFGFGFTSTGRKPQWPSLKSPFLLEWFRTNTPAFVSKDSVHYLDMQLFLEVAGRNVLWSLPGNVTALPTATGWGKDDIEVTGEITSLARVGSLGLVSIWSGKLQGPDGVYVIRLGDDASVQKPGIPLVKRPVVLSVFTVITDN